MAALPGAALVGRERERARLSAALDGVRETGRARLTLLTGPKGAGASRLADWLVKGAVAAGWTTLVARHGPLSGVRWDAPQRPEERLDALDRPAIVWIDDAPWGPEALGLALSILRTQRLRPRPILFLATAAAEDLAARSEVHGLVDDLLGTVDGSRVDVRGLRPGEISEILHGEGVSDRDAVRAITALAQGRPLLAVEAARALADGLPLDDLPADEAELWRRRIAPVDAPAFEIAGALGPLVDVYEWAAACAAAGVPLPATLPAELVRRRLLVTERGGLALVHPNLGEALLARAAEHGTLARWNRACAEAVAGRTRSAEPATGAAASGGDAASMERRARHLLAAGDAEAALDLAAAASRRRYQAGQFGAGLGAAALIGRAIDALGVAESDPRRALLAESRFLHLRGLNRKDAVTEAERFVDAAQRFGWGEALPTALRMLANSALDTSDLDRADTLGRRALDLATSAGDRAGRSDGLRILGGVYQRRGDLARAEAACREALALARELADPTRIAATASILAETLLRIGKKEESEALLAEVHGLLGPDHEYDRAMNLRRMAYAAVAREDLDAAVRYELEALKLFEHAGYTIGAAWALNTLGEVSRRRGELAAAERLYRRSLEMFASIGRTGIPIIELNLSLVLLARGACSEAREMASGAQARLEATGTRGVLPAAHAILLACAEGEGDVAGWHAHDERLRALLAETGAVEPDIGVATRTAGDLAERATDPHAPSRAVRAREIALDQWRRLGREREVAVEQDALRRLAAGGAPVPLGPFDLVAPLAAGGMGEVWLAEHRRGPGSGLEVAVKVLTALGGGRREAWRQAFRHEVRSMAALDHPGIVLVLEYDEVGAAADVMSGGRLVAGSPYVAMELAHKGSLDPWVGRLAWPQVKAVLVAVLDALGHAHARGVVHRDIKPQNVLLESADDLRPGIKLADFGLAHAIDDDATTWGMAGTPQYMSPEQFAGSWRELGPWTDLYAVGCLAYALVTGHPPFTAEDVAGLHRAHAYKSPPPLEPVVGVPEGFEAWVRRLLRKSPRERFQLAADAVWALEALPDAPARDVPEDGPGPTGDVPTLVRATYGGGTEGAATYVMGDGPGPTGDGAVAEDEGVPPCDVEVPPLPRRWGRPTAPRPAMSAYGTGLALLGVRAVPMVGRAEERDRLWEELHQVAETRRPRAAVLLGPAGIGKTRLARWLAERAQETGGARAMFATHGPVAGPGDGLAGLVAGWLRARGMSRDGLLMRAERVLRDHGATDEVEWRALVEVASPGTGVFAFANAAERFAAVRRWLQRVADRPIVLAVDDVQWGADALAFVADLLAAPDAPPVLVVLAARDDRLAGRPEERLVDQLLATPGVTRVDVGPLDADARKALVKKQLGLSGDLARQVDERTGGNPLFALELVADGVQRGWLVAGDKGLSLRRGARPALPERVHEVWEARIAELLHGLDVGREALELAAVLGAEVDGADWARACEIAGVALDPRLVDRLIATRLAVVRSGDDWAFAHGMLRESLERSAHQRGRATRWHLACAELLEGRNDARGLERRGRHLLAAGRPADAATVLLDAARAWQKAGDGHRCLELLDVHGEALVAQGAAEKDERWWEQHVRRSGTLVELGRIREALDAAERAAGVSTGEKQAEAIRRQAIALRSLGRREEARRAFEAALARFEAAGDGRGTARCQHGLGLVHLGTGRLDDAERLVAAAADWYAAHGEEEQEAHCRYGLGNIAQAAGRLDDATSLHRAARAAFEKTGNVAGLAATVNSLAEIARLRGDLDGAEAGYRESMDLYRSIGSGHAILPQMNLGLVLLARHRWVDARGVLLRSRDVLEQQGRRGELASVYAALLVTSAAERDGAAWQDELARCRTLVAETSTADPEIARLASLAGDRAHGAGLKDRSAAAWALAREQWDRIASTEATP